MSHRSPSDLDVNQNRCTALEVSAYLKANPDFFESHPEVLALIEVPHRTGSGAVSLIERQVDVLRNDNKELRGRIKELVTVARENDQLMAKVHRLNIELADAPDLDQLIVVLKQHLTDAFKVDKVAFAVFEDVLEDESGQALRFARNDERLRVFETVLKRRKPVCGRYHQDQMRVLFGLEADQIGSMALLPLSTGKPLGLIALGSEDKERFRAGMSTVFLGYMTEMLSTLLKRLSVQVEYT